MSVADGEPSILTYIALGGFAAASSARKLISSHGGGHTPRLRKRRKQSRDALVLSSSSAAVLRAQPLDFVRWLRFDVPLLGVKMRWLGMVVLCAALGGCYATGADVRAKLGQDYVGKNVDAIVVR